MEKEGINNQIDQIGQGFPNPRFNATSTTMPQADDFGPEDIGETTEAFPRHSPDVILVAGTLGTGKSDEACLSGEKRYFWRKGPFPPFIYSVGGQPLIVYESLEEYLGLSGEAVGSSSPWPELCLSESEEETAFERHGVFQPKYRRTVLFSKTISCKTSELPRWKPKNIIGMRTFEEEDV